MLKSPTSRKRPGSLGIVVTHVLPKLGEANLKQAGSDKTVIIHIKPSSDSAQLAIEELIKVRKSIKTCIDENPNATDFSLHCEFNAGQSGNNLSTASFLLSAFPEKGKTCSLHGLPGSGGVTVQLSDDSVEKLLGFESLSGEEARDILLKERGKQPCSFFKKATTLSENRAFLALVDEIEKTLPKPEEKAEQTAEQTATEPTVAYHTCSTGAIQASIQKNPIGRPAPLIIERSKSAIAPPLSLMSDRSSSMLSSSLLPAFDSDRSTSRNSCAPMQEGILGLSLQEESPMDLSNREFTTPYSSDMSMSPSTHRNHGHRGRTSVSQELIKKLPRDRERSISPRRR